MKEVKFNSEPKTLNEALDRLRMIIMACKDVDKLGDGACRMLCATMASGQAPLTGPDLKRVMEIADRYALQNF